MISDREFDAIQAGAAVETVEIDGVTYTTKPVHDVRKKEPEATSLALASLEGLVEYAVVHEGWFEEHGVAAYVAAHNLVTLVSLPFGRFHQRHEYARATVAPLDGLTFGSYVDLETFNVRLQALFVDTPARAELLKVLGHITDENVRTTADDGVTQTVVAKTGIARVGDADVPNPVALEPFRTFRELEQPESPFVLRLKSGSPVHAALYEADGGAWKLTAVDLIKAWLRENLPAEFAILG